MDKQTFYAQLAGKLTELGVGEEYINRHLTQFDSYFAGKSNEEISQEIAKLGSIDRVAARIKRITDKMISDEAEADAPEKSENTESASAERQAPHTQEPPRPREEQPRQSTARPEARRQPSASGERDGAQRTAPSAQQDNRDRRETPPPQPQQADASPEPQAPQTSDSTVSRPEIKQVDGYQPVGYSIPDSETLKRNTNRFRIIFAATLPLTLAILLAIAFLFGAAFFGIAVLIIGAVGLLVAMTAAGTLASVFGLIFGVAQMISSMPIGLYECGLSIIIGASVLFCGILVYNFAVRLMPYAAKWLLVFAKFVVKKLKELYISIKKEYIGI